ncbi:hypothetical protein SKAU_G00346260 [Synaphobranchus kaupii]|uniref:Uncharacterized protein n=1 Tax=Synaphobranchus kaupii TaxID=118154 RepID=A0A9Q1EJQ0_SYNKA|nr:hypothetical protein SKAU_G00346260 [Synaphobranchus kaupii]
MAANEPRFHGASENQLFSPKIHLAERHACIETAPYLLMINAEGKPQVLKRTGRTADGAAARKSVRKPFDKAGVEETSDGASCGG